jgi:hypothetical protein
MTFVPVAVDPSGKSRLLFSIWATRVQDYEAWSREQSGGTDDTWRNPTYEGAPVTPSGQCPVVGVSWEEAKGPRHGAMVAFARAVIRMPFPGDGRGLPAPVPATTPTHPQNRPVW